MIKQVACLVEGQTEEAFVAQILQPSPANLGLYLQPIVVSTSRTPAGLKRAGGGAWKHYHRDLNRLLAQPHWAMVTTMIDFYGYPRDAPGSECARPHDPRRCVLIRQDAMRLEVSNFRFRPFIVLHELETFVLASAVAQGSLLGNPSVAAQLKDVVATSGGDVELVNDSPDTAPSKRVTQAWPGYNKVVDGVAAIAEAGLPAIESQCPHLAGWLSDLRAV